ncbi:MAG TPA: hypothetical protein VIG76_00930 [Amnibacterium sp.]|jgi:hypothetical protein|uniref:hypothetical protein n=1 Tax=Amnibacterium sp. TaxID=1872496 RepID=UPI002F95C2E1
MRRIRRRLWLTLGLVSVVLLTACTSPAPRVSRYPRPAPTVTTAAAHEFVSKRHGFRLTLPKDWTGADAQVSWDGGLLLGVDSPAFADFTDSTGGRVITFGAAQLPRGTTLAAWQASIFRNETGSCVMDPSTTTTTLGGERALSWTVACPDQVVDLAVEHGTRGYVAIFVPLQSRMDATDLAAFDPIRRSFHFTD